MGGDYPFWSNLAGMGEAIILKVKLVYFSKVINLTSVSILGTVLLWYKGRLITSHPGTRTQGSLFPFVSENTLLSHSIPEGKKRWFYTVMTSS